MKNPRVSIYPQAAMGLKILAAKLGESETEIASRMILQQLPQDVKKALVAMGMGDGIEV